LDEGKTLPAVVLPHEAK